VMIGGATTSKAHTAVKIAPEYRGAVAYVPDASRAVGVASSLLSENLSTAFIQALNAEHAAVRERRAARNEAKSLVTLAEARANPIPIDWSGYQPPIPARPGVHVLPDIDLEAITSYIDWTFFFHAWQLKGRYPQILEDVEKGEEARKLLADAEAMLRQIIDGKWLRAAAVIGLFPANAQGDDIEFFADETREKQIATLHNLRKQGRQPAGQYNDCLADFVAPMGLGKADSIGAFACTAGIGIDAKVAEFEQDRDDYQALLLKSLADRLAEALAEWLHEQVRKKYWGYVASESFSKAELVEEKYRGIRPAVGYPASPDHTEKDVLWHLLDVERTIGMTLTESKAMIPTASVSGLYFSHPKASYFAVGKIGKDQVEDYAARKGMDLAEVERWLGPNLAYETDD